MIDFGVPQIRISMAILGLLLMGSGLASSQQFEVGLGVSSLNGSAYNLLVGMADGASDGYVAGEDLYAPPAPPSPSFYSSITYANDSWFSCIIAPDPDPQVFVLSLQFLITDPILIEWDPSLLADGGEYILRDAVGGGLHRDRHEVARVHPDRQHRPHQSGAGHRAASDGDFSSFRCERRWLL